MLIPAGRLLRRWAQAFHSSAWWEEGRQSQKLNLSVRLDVRRNLRRQTDQNGISQAAERVTRGDYPVSLRDFQEPAA